MCVHITLCLSPKFVKATSAIPDYSEDFYPPSPALLVRIAEGSSYIDTVRVIWQSEENNKYMAGVYITDIHQMRLEHLLVKRPKGCSYDLAVNKFKATIDRNLGSFMGSNSRLGNKLEVEVVNFNAVWTKEEVLEDLKVLVLVL